MTSFMNCSILNIDFDASTVGAMTFCDQIRVRGLKHACNQPYVHSYPQCTTSTALHCQVGHQNCIMTMSSAGVNGQACQERNALPEPPAHLEYSDSKGQGRTAALAAK